MTLRAGRLRRLVTIETPGTGVDAYNAPVQVWTVFATVWAEILPLSGQEMYAAQQIEAKEIYTVTCRYVAGVTTMMRVNYLGRFLDITNVNNEDERNRVLIISCKSGVNRG